MQNGTMQSTAGNLGKVTQVIGSTLDAQFPEDKLPEIYNALRVQVERTARREDPGDPLVRSRPAPRRRTGPRRRAGLDRRPAARRGHRGHRLGGHGARRPRRSAASSTCSASRSTASARSTPRNAARSTASRPSSTTLHQDRDLRDRHQGRRPPLPRSSAAARSACSAAPASARRSSFRR